VGIAYAHWNQKLPMKKRCAKCGAVLTDEDMMKIKIEDGL
jgi:hypothetical protein